MWGFSFGDAPFLLENEDSFFKKRSDHLLAKGIPAQSWVGRSTHPLALWVTWPAVVSQQLCLSLLVWGLWGWNHGIDPHPVPGSRTCWVPVSGGGSQGRLQTHTFPAHSMRELTLPL